MEGNEINLDKWLDTAKEISKKQQEIKESKMEEFRKIVKGVAKKYASKYVDREDLEQELWVTTLELIQSKGGDENLDGDLVARSCLNKAVDFYRYGRRRVDTSRKMLEDWEMDDEEHSSKEDSQILYSNFQTGFDASLIRDVIELFPEGSRERKYVVTKLYMYGDIDTSENLPDELEIPEKDTEVSVLHMLGYTGKTISPSWIKTKKQILRKVYDYLGILKDKELTKEERVKKIKERVDFIFNSSTRNYIYANELVKDSVIDLLDCSAEELFEILKDYGRYVIGIGWSSKETYYMKNKKLLIQGALEEGDYIYGISDGM
jgi:DNA-directed RNA polymerase specialized sigma24 family protein